MTSVTMSIADWPHGDGLVADVASGLARRGVVLRHDGHQSFAEWLQNLKEALDSSEDDTVAKMSVLGKRDKGSSTYKMKPGQTDGRHEREADKTSQKSKAEEIISKISTTGRKDVAKFSKGRKGFGATTPR